MKTFSICLVFMFLLVSVCWSAKIDRCQQYVQVERVQHWKYFGLGFPYHYGVGQIRQESSCRPNITSFDGGKGLSQFMPATLRDVEKSIGAIDIWNPSSAIKAQAWYMAKLHRGNFAEARPLWITYMFYNSGPGTVKKEYLRAGSANYNLMRASCKRKVLQLRSGPLDLCDVGYEYPVLVYKYGKQYKLFSDWWRYW